MPVARVNDIELNYKLEGDGEDTIVLVNGLADDLETWVLQVDDFLAAGYRVLRFDNRGVGGSAKPAGPYTTELFAADRSSICRTQVSRSSASPLISTTVSGPSPSTR